MAVVFVTFFIAFMHIMYDTSELLSLSYGQEDSTTQLRPFFSEGQLGGKEETKNEMAELPFSSGWSLSKEKLTPLVFVHIHKAGGTTICMIAHAVGVRIPKPSRSQKDRTSWFSKNCNPTFADGDRGRAYGFKGPDAMLKYAEEVEMYALEWPMPSQLSSELNLLLVLREPLHMFFSLCVTELQKLSVSPNVASIVDKARECMYKNKQYQTKYLVGCKAAGLQACPYSEIQTLNATREDVMLAMKIVEEQAVVVFITERLDEIQPLLLTALGWNLTTSAAQHRGGTHKTWVEELPGWGPSVHEQNQALGSALKTWSPKLHYEYVISSIGDRQLYNAASRRFAQMLSQAKKMVGVDMLSQTG